MVSRPRDAVLHSTIKRFKTSKANLTLTFYIVQGHFFKARYEIITILTFTLDVEGVDSRYAVYMRPTWGDIGTGYTYWTFSQYQWDLMRAQLMLHGVNPADFGIYGMCGLGVEVHNALYQGMTDYVNVFVS